MNIFVEAVVLGVLAVFRPNPWRIRTPQSQHIWRTDEWNAQRIELSNHLYQIKCGDDYRCMWCKRESPAILWADMPSVD